MWKKDGANAGCNRRTHQSLIPAFSFLLTLCALLSDLNLTPGANEEAEKHGSKETLESDLSSLGAIYLNFSTVFTSLWVLISISLHIPTVRIRDNVEQVPEIYGMSARSLQQCLTLCDPMDCSPPASSVHGILQARILEWVAMPISSGSSQPRN